MRVIREMLSDIESKTFDIGFVGEKNHTCVMINCVSLFKQYPDAVATMVARPPVGDIYPVILNRDGVFVVWNVSESDIANAGSGQYQLTFTDGEGDNAEIIKTVYGSFFVKPSMVSNGEAPDPIEDWLEEANEALAEFGKINELSASATTLAPGQSATAEITTVSGHKNIAIGVPKGDKGDKGDPAPEADVKEAVDEWLDENITNPDSPPLDRSLSASSAAAPADLVGDLKSAFNNSSRIGEQYYFYNSGSQTTWYDIEFPASSDTSKLIFLYSDSATVKVHIYRKVNGSWEETPVTGFTNLTGLNVGKYFDVPIVTGTTAIRIYIFNNTDNAYVSAYLCKKKTDGLLYDVSSAVQELIESASGFSLDSDLFVNGTIVNGAVDPSVTCRAVTAKKVNLLADVYFDVASGFRVYFTPSSYDWVTGKKKIAKGEYFITIARVTETASEVADIPSFVSKVSCAYDIQKKLKETEDKADETLKLNSQICKAAFDNETPKASSVVTHADGTTGSYNGWYNSNKMILSGYDGEEINYTAPSYNVNTTNIPAICFFDIRGNFLGCSTTASGNNYLDRSVHSATIPNGTYFITITSYSWNSVDNYGKAWVNTIYNKDNILTSNKLFNDANIICIGDSLTEGDYGSDPAGLANIHRESYPYFMQKYLGNNITNAGRSGYNTKQYYTNVINANTYNFASYDVVVIMLGTNSGLTDTLDTDVLPYNNYTDYADTQTGNYCKIIESIMSKNPDIQIVLCTSPYVDPTRRADHAQTTADANAVIPKIAKLYGLPVIDTYNELGVNAKNTNIYQPVDGLHGGIKFYSKLGFFIGSKLKSIYNCVLDNVGNLAWITIPHGRYYVSVGNTVTFAHNEYPEGTPITWESANTSIATVDDNGVVTGVSQGLVWIYATVTDANGETHSARQDVSV